MADILSPSVRNITRLFRTATVEERTASAAWYAEAHAIAVELAESGGITVEAAAGVLAAVSPMMSWAANVKVARKLVAAGGHAEGGCMRANLLKANRIILGESPLDVLGGDKVRNFFLSILTLGAEGVTIDRHAYDLAVNVRHAEGERPTLKGRRYVEFQAAYQRAARILSSELGETITAGQVQSVTWVKWRAKFWAVGAFDLKDAA